nr:MAG TPA: tail fiber protein [Bacteriophage sp.]
MLAHVDNRITYSGNGNATEFAYQFKILDRTDIKVLLTDADGKEKLLTKDYYVDVEKNVVRYPGYAVGAEVPESERPPVLPTGWKLTIYREVPVTQETDLPDQYPFNQVEDIGDKLTMIAQQLTDVTGRSLKIGVSTSADIDTTIPWENGKSFRISDDGKTLELSEDPAKVLPLAQGVYAQAQAQAQSAAVSATAAAKSENSAAASANAATNSAQSASTSAASAAENARLSEGYKTAAETAKTDASLYATNAKTSENSASASKETAQSAATTASNFATDARSSAGEAKTYKDNAKTYKDNAKTYMDNAKTYMDNAKNYSENVNVFVPSVSSDGVLSWTNKAGLTNPTSVNIKGAKGDTGTAASIKIGSVITGAAGSNASVTNSGTASNVVLNFTLPRGKDGKDGGVTVDAELSDTSTNPVQNRAVKAALDNRAVLDDTNTFTSPNTFDIIYMQKNIGSIRWYEGSQSVVVGHVNAESYTGEANTAKKASKDGDGNVITSTYATKTELNSYVKTVNNTAPDESGNVNITVSGGSDITVDDTLSSTSTNAIQNRVVYNALTNKVSTDIYSGFALIGATSTIVWRQGSQPVGSINASSYTGSAASATKATQDSAGNVIVDTYAKKTDISGMVKSVNNVKPDSNGNVTIAVSGGSGVSTSESNTWTAQQNFRDLMLNREKYTTYVVNGTSDTPVTSTMVYAVTGAFTLNLATLAGALSASQSSVFTAYFAANADYSLTISNAGKLKYTGSASDVAITTSGLLLNIWMSKDGGGTLTSIVQATKLS